MSRRGRNNGGGRRLNGQKQRSKRCNKLKGKQQRKCLGVQKGDIKNKRKGRTNNPKKYVTRYFEKKKKKTLGKKLSTFEHFFTFRHIESKRETGREPVRSRESQRKPERA